jgi:nucleotide-binding universal stress UspA family protein
MYKTIVTGTDGSESANKAVAHAIQLAKLASAKLHIVSAYKSVPAIAMAAPDAMSQLGATSADWESQVVAEVKALLQRFEQQAKDDGVDAQTHAIDGDPSEVIVELADKAKADLIVVGNRGMTGAGRFLLGSVPNKISHHSPCSVLIVHTA